MKTTAIILLALISSASFAASTNFDSIYINDDGSVSIIGPHFKDPTGDGNRDINPDSDLNGVCKLFGYGAVIPSSMQYYDSHRETVLINSDGRFSNFANGYAITNLACQADMPVFKNNYGRLLTNDDGSVTVVRPQFNMNGQTFRINPDSDLNGICRLYGMQNFINNSMKYEDTHQATVHVNSTSKFGYYANGYGITSMMCE